MRKSTKLFVKLFSLVLVVALSFSVSVTSLSVTAGAAASDYVSKYRSDATDRKDALVRADAINQKIVEEGAVLLKNEGETLPLAPGKKISVSVRTRSNPSITEEVPLPVMTTAAAAVLNLTPLSAVSKTQVSS